MRFLFYNIAYATGSPRSTPHFLMTMHRYLRSSPRHFERLREFIRSVDADITGVVEMDSGSFRARRANHARELAASLDQHHSFQTKYHYDSVARKLPVLRHQGNAIFSRDQAERNTTHFFTYGFKRLVMESRIAGVDIFLVHLSLSREVRRKQLLDLHRLVGDCHHHPVIVAGDFNARRGAVELEDFMQGTGLVSANREGVSTFPAWNPQRELDFILHSPVMRVQRFEVLKQVRLSDHLPMVMDFSV